jgi:hypothetical protein
MLVSIKALTNAKMFSETVFMKPVFWLSDSRLKSVPKAASDPEIVPKAA